jgi:hypothetical protein
MQTVQVGDHVVLNDGTEMKVFRISDSGWINGVTENNGDIISTRIECVAQITRNNIPFPFCDMSAPKKKDLYNLMNIKSVIFNPPATIVLWEDGTKTVVKCHNEPFDKEKGLAMALLRAKHGSGIRKLFKKWCADDKDET